MWKVKLYFRMDNDGDSLTTKTFNHIKELTEQSLENTLAVNLKAYNKDNNVVVEKFELEALNDEVNHLDFIIKPVVRTGQTIENLDELTEIVEESCDSLFNYGRMTVTNDNYEQSFVVEVKGLLLLK